MSSDSTVGRYRTWRISHVLHASLLPALSSGLRRCPNVDPHHLVKHQFDNLCYNKKKTHALHTSTCESSKSRSMRVSRPGGLELLCRILRSRATFRQTGPLVYHFSSSGWTQRGYQSVANCFPIRCTKPNSSSPLPPSCFSLCSGSLRSGQADDRPRRRLPR